MATKAFNALKEVSSPGPKGSPHHPACLKEPHFGVSGPSGNLWEARVRAASDPLYPPQLVQECNASVQSMKRTEELIHLSKKIHFEGKVSVHDGRIQKGSSPHLPWGCRLVHHCPYPPDPA